MLVHLHWKKVSVLNNVAPSVAAFPNLTFVLAPSCGKHLCYLIIMVNLEDVLELLYMEVPFH